MFETPSQTPEPSFLLVRSKREKHHTRLLVVLCVSWTFRKGFRKPTMVQITGQEDPRQLTNSKWDSSRPVQNAQGHCGRLLSNSNCVFLNSHANSLERSHMSRWIGMDVLDPSFYT